MKKVPDYLIPALNAGVVQQVLPYEKTMDYILDELSYDSEDRYWFREERDIFTECCVGVIQRLATKSPEKQAALPERFWYNLGKIVDCDMKGQKNLCWCSLFPFELCNTDLECIWDCFYGNELYKNYGWTYEELKWVTYGENTPPSCG